jgi:NAD(P)-dependent dehydrogenase (short-subunit alcohol dehydrogenase family)
VGAAVAQAISADSTHVIIHFREKHKRAEAVASAIRVQGGSASTVGADITSNEAVARLTDHIDHYFGRLDVLVLNASGGLELSAPPGYAMAINRDAQVNMVNNLSPLMIDGGRVVFVTSHQAHFYPGRPVPPDYLPIAESKRAGEDALLAMRPALRLRGIGVGVVSGDMIDGTIIIRLAQRRDAASVQSRRELTGRLPTIDEFAHAIAAATHSGAADEDTVYVGGADYLS